MVADPRDDETLRFENGKRVLMQKVGRLGGAVLGRAQDMNAVPPCGKAEEERGRQYGEGSNTRRREADRNASAARNEPSSIVRLLPEYSCAGAVLAIYPFGYRGMG